MVTINALQSQEVLWFCHSGLVVLKKSMIVHTLFEKNAAQEH